MRSRTLRVAQLDANGKPVGESVTIELKPDAIAIEFDLTDGDTNFIRTPIDLPSRLPQPPG